MHVQNTKLTSKLHTNIHTFTFPIKSIVFCTYKVITNKVNTRDMFIIMWLLELACQKLSSFDESINESSPFWINPLEHGIDSNGISTTAIWLAITGCTVGSYFSCISSSSSLASLLASIS